MSSAGSGSVLGALSVGAGRRIGGAINKHVDGANMVHAVAIQGLFNAHAQQQEHEHHLASVREAYKMSPEGGFTIKTGAHHFELGGTSGGKGGGHDESGNRTPPPEDHFEAARSAAKPEPTHVPSFRAPQLALTAGTSSAPDLKQQVLEGSAQGRADQSVRDTEAQRGSERKRGVDRAPNGAIIMPGGSNRGPIPAGPAARRKRVK